MPALLSDTDREALQRQVRETTQARMFRELAEALEVLTAEQPLVLAGVYGGERARGIDPLEL